MDVQRTSIDHSHTRLYEITTAVCVVVSAVMLGTHSALMWHDMLEMVMVSKLVQVRAIVMATMLDWTTGDGIESWCRYGQQ